MNDQCLNCRIRKSCYYKEPEEDWTCEHYGYFNGLLGEIDKVENGGEEVNNEQISEKQIDEATINHNAVRMIDKVINAPGNIINDTKEDRHDKILLMIGEIAGITWMANVMKEVLKS